MPQADDLYTEDARRDLHERLGKVEGQLRGVGRMIDGQRTAVGVLQQLASIRSAVKGVTKAVLRAYVEKCAADVPARAAPVCSGACSPCFEVGTRSRTLWRGMGRRPASTSRP